MKCTIHGIDMEYTGEDPFGGDVWFCEHCHAEEEAQFERSYEYELDEPFDEPGEDDDFLWDEELDDDGVYEGDVVIHQPYDDEE